jgi:hypothetical protein
MRGASGDEWGNLVLGQEYNRPAEAGVLKKPRGSDFNFNFFIWQKFLTLFRLIRKSFKREGSVKF